jgi:hypothetical protein
MQELTAPPCERDSRPIRLLDMATTRNPPPCPRNYLLRVLSGAGGPRYVVQDLRTGERQQFAGEDELRRFLALRAEPNRLR